jgi:hypothetical protein
VTDTLGWLAASLTLVTFSMRTMMPLRISAVASNVFFILYGWQAALTPVFALHCVLLPFNLFRLGEILVARHRFDAVRSGVVRRNWLNGLGTTLRLTAGDVVFGKGDPADYLYQVLRGEVEIPEIGHVFREGDIFGEIAFFTSAHARTLGARARTDCELVAVDQRDFMAIHYQDPSFGVYLTKLIAERLLDGMAHAPQAYRVPKTDRGPTNPG